MVGSLTPKVTTEDVRLALNGTITGSNYYFWGQSITSGSVLAQINLANYYLYGILGTDVMDSVDTITFYHVKTCELDYSCMRLLCLLSGDVIVDGFYITAGITIQQPSLLSTYRLLISEFKESAQLHLRAIQPIAVSGESDTTTYRETAPSYF
jgi:hypothetical protein